MRPSSFFVLIAVILAAPAVEGQAVTASGQVVDATTRVPIRGARLRSMGPDSGTIGETRGDGRFRITLGSGGPVRVSRDGYRTLTVTIGRDTAGLVIALSPIDEDASRRETARALEGLTITAVRAGGDAPIAQTTLDRARIERDYSGQDLPLTVRQAPSVTAYSESGSLLNYSYFRIRGIDQSRINITLDGVPLNEPEDQQIYFSDFPDLTASVQSLQVQRGVGTSTYGQAAYGGSVNLATATLTGAPRQVALHLGAGSFNTTRATIEGNSGAVGRLAVHGRLSGIQSDGYREGASSDANSIYASASYLGDRDLLKFIATSGLERNGQSYAAIPLDELRVNPRANPLAGVGDKYRESMATLAYTRLISPVTSAGVTAYAFGTRGFYDYPSGAPGPALRFRSASRWVGAIGAAHTVAGRVTVDAGAHAMSYSKDHEFDDRPDLQYPGYSNTGFKSEASAFAKASLDLGAATLFSDLQLRSAEFRYRPTRGYGLSEVSQRWSFVNPKVGLSVRATPRVALFASFGTTGREPTRGDLFAGADDVTPDDAPALLPLTRVRPEHVNDLEAGATLAVGRLRVDANVFDMRFRDEIARTGATTPLGYDIRANVGRSYRRGIEVDGRMALTPALDVGASLTLSRNRIHEYRDESRGTTHRNVEPILTPAFLASHQVTWRATPRLTLTLDGRYQGRTSLAPVGNANLTTPPFHVVDGGLRFEAAGQAILIQGRNLLDRRAYPAGDVSGAGVPRYFILAPRSLDVTVTLRR